MGSQKAKTVSVVRVEHPLALAYATRADPLTAPNAWVYWCPIEASGSIRLAPPLHWFSDLIEVSRQTSLLLHAMRLGATSVACIGATFALFVPQVL